MNKMSKEEKIKNRLKELEELEQELSGGSQLLLEEIEFLKELLED